MKRSTMKQLQQDKENIPYCAVTKTGLDVNGIYEVDLNKLGYIRIETNGKDKNFYHLYQKIINGEIVELKYRTLRFMKESYPKLNIDL